MKTLGGFNIFVTCKQYEEIYAQLIEEGIDSKYIYDGRSLIKMLQYVKLDRSMFNERRNKVLFDLQLGLVLGGVESWTFQTAEILRDNDFYVRYLTTNINKPLVSTRNIDLRIFNYQDNRTRDERVLECVQEILRFLPCNIICNFPSDIFVAACLVKNMYPNLIHLISIVHSDYVEYYEVYGSYKKWIDEIVVISSRMKDKLMGIGFSKNKIHMMQWEIACEKSLRRKYSKIGEKIHLGYAGRITIRQKRVDHLLELAILLRSKNVGFIMELAGIGDYEEELKEEIKNYHLEDSIYLLGLVKREKLREFWIKQDIMLGCSEIEGRSISQQEAMASGVVPIVTDTSGAKDDVKDGYNGFVVDIGDISVMASKIMYLYENRDILELMGKSCYEIIRNRMEQINSIDFWNTLLRKVWNE